MGQERLCFKPKVFIRAPLQLPVFWKMWLVKGVRFTCYEEKVWKI